MQELIIKQTSINETINTLCNLTFIIAGIIMSLLCLFGPKIFRKLFRPILIVVILIANFIFMTYAYENKRSAINNKDYEITVHNKTLSVHSQSKWFTSIDLKIDDESDDYYYILVNKKLYQIAKAETR